MTIPKKTSIILLAILLLFSVSSGCIKQDASDSNAQTTGNTQNPVTVISTAKANETTTATAISTTKADATTVKAAPTTATTAATTQDKSSIPWNEAINHIGETVTIRGPVISTKYATGSTGKPTFLNIGLDYPEEGRFTVVIFDDYRANFSQAPEVLYAFKTVKVTGTVKLYNGAAEIEVRTPSQIQIV